jgi:hypothetical protein
MRAWMILLRIVHDNIGIIFFSLLVAVFGVAWLVIEAIRSHRDRDEIFKLRHRITQLERERIAARPAFPEPVMPVVMPDRWIRVGAAATTSDGGCLILVDNVAPDGHTAQLTIRVDGYAVKRSEPLRVGESFQLSGNSGLYLVSLYGTDVRQAHLGVGLRNRHSTPNPTDGF